MVLFATMRASNEGDIIESTCRHALSYCDGMIVYDSFSTDNTRAILEALVEEGLNLIIDADIKERQVADKLVPSEMVRIAIDNYGADWVMPLDADEFLLTEDGGDLRGAIAALDPACEYNIYWRTYVLTEEAEKNDVFLPDSFPFYRNGALEAYYKTLISAPLYKNNPCKVSAGNHGLEYLDPEAPRAPMINPMHLRMAHYPIRSRWQAFLKMILGEVYFLYTREPGHSFQYEWAYHDMMAHGFPSLEYARKLSAEYALNKEQIAQDLPLGEGYLSHPDIKLKYTDYGYLQKNGLSIFLTQLREILEKRVAEWKECRQQCGLQAQQIAALEQDISALTQQLGEANQLHEALSGRLAGAERANAGQQDQLASLREELEASRRETAECRHALEEIRFSTSWRITAPLRAVVSAVKRNPSGGGAGGK